MEKTYYLDGLACANCANKIETAVAKLDGVSSASLNFISTTLKLCLKEGYSGDITREVEDVVHSFEPDIVVADKSEIGALPETDEPHKKRLLRIICGALLFLGAILARNAAGDSIYARVALFLPSYIVLGGGVMLMALRNIYKGHVFDENFLMAVATIGAFAIGDFAEASAVMLFYQTGEYFQDLAVARSKRSISALMEIRPDYANLVDGDELRLVAPETVSIGDIIAIKPGERIPLDCKIISGASSLDTSALTGESYPRNVKPGDTVLSGCINQSGVLKAEVTKTYGESTVAKIIDLVENAASNKAPTESFITKFSKYYTPAVVAFAALLATIPPLIMGGGWADWINRGLIFLVISCPCALVISIPLGFFAGIGGASKQGVLVKGGNYLEALNNLDTVVFDKTGTLTKGVFELTGIYPSNGYSDEALLEYAAYAEAYSSHPIALSIVKAYKKPIDKSVIEEYTETAGKGVSVMLRGKSILAGNIALMEGAGIAYVKAGGIGAHVYISVDGVFAGSMVVSDEIKPDAKTIASRLHDLGIRKAVMLTGDNEEAAQAISAELGLDEVHAGLLPGQKLEKLDWLKTLTHTNRKLAFVGDGINDAPAIAGADIGIAMGGLGSDAAIEAADIVLMTDEPSKLLDAIGIAGFTKRVVWQNIVFALGIKGLFLLFGALGLASMWAAVFADVGVAIIAIFNSMRILGFTSR